MKIKHLAGLFATLFAFVACGPKGPSSVVIYYSQSGTTKAVAEQFAAQTGSDIIELVPATPYPDTYQGTIEESREEATNGTGRPLVQSKFNLKKYDTIYLGYPIWFGTYAPPITTFLADNDLSGKKLVLFCTYGSGGRKASAAELKTLEPNASVTLAYGISNKRVTAENGAAAAAEEIKTFFADLEAGKTDEMLMGGYSEQRPLTAEDSAVFAAATKDYAYLSLKPLSVSTQVVAGTNFLFTCEMKAFGGPAVQTNVKIFRPLPGRGEPELIVVEK